MAKKESNSLKTHINKGLTKHQAVNAACGAGRVKAPGPDGGGKSGKKPKK